MPPLRDRRDDIPLHAEHFIQVYREKNAKPIAGRLDPGPGGTYVVENGAEDMKEDIWNTVCPVCGSPIPHDMALMEFSHLSEGHQHQHQEQPGIRICSTDCAKVAEKSPEQYRAAAAMNSVAAGGKRSSEHP